MSAIDRNHPAVEAMLWHEGQYNYGEPPENWPEQSRGAAAADYADKIEHVLPHLTADDLRDTPAGRALLAEGWREGANDAQDHHENPTRWPTVSNPYRT